MEYLPRKAIIQRGRKWERGAIMMNRGGIAILLFAIVLALCSSGMDWLILIVGVTGLLFSITGFFDKSN